VAAGFASPSSVLGRLYRPSVCGGPSASVLLLSDLPWPWWARLAGPGMFPFFNHCGGILTILTCIPRRNSIVCVSASAETCLGNGWRGAIVRIELVPGARTHSKLAARLDFCLYKLWNHLSWCAGGITEEVHLLLLIQPVV
jgi:hypothetical protein